MEEFFTDKEQFLDNEEFGTSDFVDTPGETAEVIYNEMSSDDIFETFSPEQLAQSKLSDTPIFGEDVKQSETEPQAEESEELPAMVNEDMELILTQLTKIQETESLIQKELQIQTKNEMEYYRYSFLVFMMIFTALFVYLVFSKVQV